MINVFDIVIWWTGFLDSNFQEVRYVMVLPILSVIILFSRQIVGLKTYGVYGPLILSLGYLENEWWLSIMLSWFLIFGGIIGDKFIRRLNFSYSSNTAMDLFVLAFLAILVLIVLNLSGYDIDINITVPFIITTFVVKQYNRVSETISWQGALDRLFVTIILSLIGYIAALVYFNFVNDFISVFMLGIASLLGSFLLSVYTGLRITELYRFKHLLFREDSTKDNDYVV